MCRKEPFFSVLAILIVLFIFEWFARIFVSWRDFKKTLHSFHSKQEHNLRLELERMTRIDPDIGFFYSADSQRTLSGPEFVNNFKFADLGVDSLRFRDDGIDINRKQVLLAVGDSFVWGYGVELNETFTEQLEELDENLDVINAGFAGFTPQQYTRVIKRFVKSNKEFDGVLYCVFGGNDVWGEYSFREWSKHIKSFPKLANPQYMGHSLISSKAIQHEVFKKTAKNRHSNFVEYTLENWLVSFRIARRIYWLFSGQTSLKNTVNPWNNINSFSKTDSGWYVFPKNPEVKGFNGETFYLATDAINSVACETLSESRIDAEAQFLLNFPLLMQSIIEAKNLCDSLGSDFHLVYVPAKAEVYADTLCSKLGGSQRAILREKMNTLRKKVIMVCDSLRIRMIDLTGEIILREKQGAKLYYNMDGHLNAEGHKLWAEMVLDYLKREDLKAVETW
jgi:lysophospholipase L1-like esterase